MGIGIEKKSKTYFSSPKKPNEQIPFTYEQKKVSPMNCH